MKFSRAGFTMIEVLIVVALTIGTAVAGFTGFSTFRKSQTLKLGVQELAATLSSARQRAVAQENGFGWGTRLISGTSTDAHTYQIFYGNSFSTGTTTQSYALGRGAKFSNPQASSTMDIIFAGATGFPASSQVITLINGFTDGQIGDVIIKSLGSIATRLDTGLVGYWHLDEGTATTTYDASGYSNNGTITNSPAWTSGTSCKSGGCLNFDGVNDYINLPSINPISAITVTAWIKSANSSGYGGVWQLISKYSAFILGTGSVGGKNMNFIVNINNSWQYGTYYTVSDPNNWHFFAGVFDSSSSLKKLYVDGVQQTSDTVTGTITADTGPIHIAHRENDAIGTNHFGGYIDEVKIYDRALSAAEILAAYNDLK